MYYPIIRAFFALCAIGTGLRAVVGAPLATRPDSVPVCAIIVPAGSQVGQSPLIGMLEAKLSGGGQVRLVERAEIDKVAREFELTKVLGAEGVGERSALGTVLKADLLVILNTRNSGDQDLALDVVVAQTATGLRLRVATLAWKAEAEKQLDQVTAVIEQALNLHFRPVLRVVAVPVFASTDLLHDRDYLKTTYARYAEQAAIVSQGVVLVELEEARAIDRERGLAGASNSVQRPAPVYVMGEYRSDGEKDDYTVKLAVRLENAANLLGTKKTQNIGGSRAAAWIREAVGELLKGAGVPGASAPDPQGEVTQLVARAKLMMRSASWAEALDLVEAAILLKGDDYELRRLAIKLSHHTIGDLVPYRKRGERYTLEPGDPVEDYMKRAALALDRAERVTDHERHAVRLMQPFEISSVREARSVGYDWQATRPPVELEADISSRFERIESQVVSIYLDELERRVSKGEIAAKQLKELTGWTFAEQGAGVSETKRFLKCVQDVPGAELAILQAIGFFFSSPDVDPNEIEGDQDILNRLKDPQVSAFFEYLSTLSGTSARNAMALIRNWQGEAVNSRIEKARALFEEGIKEAEKKKRYTSLYLNVDEKHYVRQDAEKGKLPKPLTTSQLAEPEPDAVLIPLSLRWPSEPLGFGIPRQILAWTGCGAKGDAVLTPKEILVLGDGGRLTSIYRSADDVFVPGGYWLPVDRPEFFFDGTYIWAVARNCKEPYLVAIDPSRKKAFELNRERGLPPMGHVLIDSAGNGIVFVASAFGKTGSAGGVFDRTWCGLVCISEDGKATVDVMLEASTRTELSTSGRYDPNPPLGTVFQPYGVICSVPAPGKRADKALVFRKQRQNNLLFDLTTRKIQEIENVPPAVGTTGPIGLVIPRLVDDAWVYWPAGMSCFGMGPPDYLPARQSGMSARPQGFVILGNVTAQTVRHAGLYYSVFGNARELMVSTDVRLPGMTLRVKTPEGFFGISNGLQLRLSARYGLVLVDTESSSVFQVQIKPAAMELIRSKLLPRDAELLKHESIRREQAQDTYKRAAVRRELPKSTLSDYIERRQAWGLKLAALCLLGAMGVGIRVRCRWRASRSEGREDSRGE